jgi:hypothetical protein
MRRRVTRIEDRGTWELREEVAAMTVVCRALSISDRV